MKKIAVTNLGLIVTERCNLNCAHCLMGGATNKEMSDDVIEASLNQFKYIMNLSICGGEPTLSLDRIEKVFSYIIENRILVDHVSITINGTVYSEEFLKLLDKIENFINPKGRKPAKTNFRISYDKFHADEITRLNLVDKFVENVRKYQNSPYFVGLSRLGSKVFNEGNAEKLDANITVPFKPYQMMMTYVGDDNKLDIDNGFCYVGPFVTITPDGMVTECDASNQHQKELYNYGNVLEDSIENIFLLNGAKILKPKKLERALSRQIKKYKNYLK